jgi:ADP-ribose pyrophosphatase YjhB (NUDIX family)
MNTARSVLFCSYCATRLRSKVLPGDTTARPWCPQCESAHYENPTILVAVFLYTGKKLFWTRRGIEPFAGKWAVPAGYVECGESLQQAAARELFEETRVRVEPDSLVPMSISSVLPIDQVYMVFRGEVSSELEAQNTTETLEWGWFSRAQAPWNQMAHPESRPLVEQVYDAVESGDFFMRVGRMGADGSHHRVYQLEKAGK